LEIVDILEVQAKLRNKFRVGWWWWGAHFNHTPEKLDVREETFLKKHMG
jgi:hypothetical protein